MLNAKIAKLINEQVNKELERRIFYDETDGNSDED